jgi:hypothetical protein
MGRFNKKGPRQRALKQTRRMEESHSFVLIDLGHDLSMPVTWVAREFALAHASTESFPKFLWWASGALARAVAVRVDLAREQPVPDAFFAVVRDATQGRDRRACPLATPSLQSPWYLA